MPIPTGNEIKALVSRTVEPETIIFSGDGLRIEMSLERWAGLGAPSEIKVAKHS
jgi:hypothetical protein